MLANKTTIIIPTLNEEKNIGLLLQLLNLLYPGIHTIIVDDGSSDETRAIAKNNGAHVIDRTKKKIKGLCASVLEGINATQTTYFIVMDGDLQHPPETVLYFMKALQTFDLVVGNRKKVLVPWPAHRKVISKTATLFAKARLVSNPQKCKDPLSGFFGGNTKRTQYYIERNKKRFVPEGYKVLFDILKLLPRKTRIKNINYSFGLRKGGTSKMTMKHTGYFLKSLIK